jgi:hypothetical protein
MTENKITGHIILQSNEALRAFERELPVLEKAFKDSGFSETNLEMFFASDGSADGGNFGGQERWQEGDFLSQALAAPRYEVDFDQSGYNRLEVSSESLGLKNGGQVSAYAPGRTPVNLLV